MAVRTLNWTESDGTRPLVLYDNLLKDATVTPSAAEDALTLSTYEAWVFDKNPPGVNVTFDLGEEKEFDGFACVGVKNGEKVELSISDNGSSFDLIHPVEVDFGRECCNLFLFNKRSARYFRARFLNDEPGEMSVRSFWLSKSLEFKGGVGYNYTPIWLGWEKETLTSVTLNGQFVGNRVISKGSSTNIPMLAEERTFIEGDLLPFMRHYNEGQPFIWASGPTVFDQDVAYVWKQSNEDIKPTFDQSGNWMSFNLSVEGFVE